ncbi:MAG: M23 family metallopeptidase [Candidatus Moranbacteria bacterium]|nr:M23 family metallopeptidase [Candidatus Moranbacteria bacterium]
MKKKSYIFLFFLVVILIIAGFFVINKAQAPQVNTQNKTVNTQNTANNNQPVLSTDVQNAKPSTVDPIENALSRITKKPFGTYITPKTSPVQPERFQGYHTAVDLETFPNEQNIDVPVKAFCDGKLLSARTASGYGGVAVQSCNLDGQAVTVVYGHIRLSSVTAKVGDQLNTGDFLANLGTRFSSQTDGERKHLHLGIHLGTGINILGYVPNKNQLSGWLDPVKYLN